jgi:hypothetical protein
MKIFSIFQALSLQMAPGRCQVWLLHFLVDVGVLFLDRQPFFASSKPVEAFRFC